MLWWHVHLPLEFQWFVEGDFITGMPAWVLWPAGGVTAALALAHLTIRLRSRHWSPGRDLWMLATAAGHSALDICVLVRPRGGDFLYTELERETMARDIDAVKDLGAAGVVLGALDRDLEVLVGERAREDDDVRDEVVHRLVVAEEGEAGDPGR